LRYEDLSLSLRSAARVVVFPAVLLTRGDGFSLKLFDDDPGVMRVVP